MVPARSHKSNDAGSIPAPATMEEVLCRYCGCLFEPPDEARVTRDICDDCISEEIPGGFLNGSEDHDDGQDCHGLHVVDLAFWAPPTDVNVVFYYEEDYPDSDF